MGRRLTSRVIGFATAAALLSFACPVAALAASEELDCPLSDGKTALHFWVDYDLGSVKWALTTGQDPATQSFQTLGVATKVDITEDHISLHAGSNDVTIDRATGHLQSSNGMFKVEGECTPGNLPPPDGAP